MDGAVVAVKVLNKAKARGSHGVEFKRTFESLLTLRHPNVIQLVGYRYEVEKDYAGQSFGDAICTALCTEYAARGNLGRYISDAGYPFDWPTCYKIIRGTLEGLSYILDHPSGCLINHLDIKPENILLCHNNVPKIKDFGMTRLYRQRRVHTGDPYLPYGVTTTTTDPREHYTFSLGVIIIKVVAGSDTYEEIEDMPQQQFIEAIMQVKEKWRRKLKGTPMRQSLSKAYCEQVNTCLEIGLRCVDTGRKERPAVSEIIDELNKLENMFPENNSETDVQVNEIQALERILVDATADPVMLSYAVLKQTTNDFSQNIGSGGFAEVYMGVVENVSVADGVVENMKIAVKKLSRTDEFSESISG